MTGNVYGARFGEEISSLLFVLSCQLPFFSACPSNPLVSRLRHLAFHFCAVFWILTPGDAVSFQLFRGL